MVKKYPKKSRLREVLKQRPACGWLKHALNLWRPREIRGANQRTCSKMRNPCPENGRFGFTSKALTPGTQHTRTRFSRMVQTQRRLLLGPRSNQQSASAREGMSLKEIAMKKKPLPNGMKQPYLDTCQYRGAQNRAARVLTHAPSSQ